jgi:hypothetical protein
MLLIRCSIIIDSWPPVAKYNVAAAKRSGISLADVFVWNNVARFLSSFTSQIKARPCGDVTQCLVTAARTYVLIVSKIVRLDSMALVLLSPVTSRITTAEEITARDSAV